MLARNSLRRKQAGEADLGMLVHREGGLAHVRVDQQHALAHRRQLHCQTVTCGGLAFFGICAGHKQSPRETTRG